MQKRKLEDLNLMDDFLMNRVMADTVYGEEFARTLLGIIFQREIGPLTIIPQKVEYGLDTDCHGIRMDVYMDEEEAGIFDLEPDQTGTVEGRNSLPRRVRFYHSKLDVAALESGSDYKSLRNVCVIFVTTYDPFDKKRMVYTIKNSCEEEPQLPYDDGAKTIFLYTKGKNGNPPVELAELLRYMENTSEKNACNGNLEKLHRMVQHTKQDAKVGLAYMKWNEIRDMWWQEGKLEGRREGKQEGKQEGTILFAIKIVKKMLQQNQSMEEISQFTELPPHLAKKIVRQINVHPEWDGEQILKGIQEQEK